jgi:hypothetical protein
MGYGAVFQQSWFYGEWDDNWEDINITVKELYPIVLALELWGNTQIWFLIVSDTIAPRGRVCCNVFDILILQVLSVQTVRLGNNGWLPEHSLESTIKVFVCPTKAEFCGLDSRASTFEFIARLSSDETEFSNRSPERYQPGRFSEQYRYRTKREPIDKNC